MKLVGGLQKCYLPPKTDTRTDDKHRSEEDTLPVGPKQAFGECGVSDGAG